jgi:hypothetical protein
VFVLLLLQECDSGKPGYYMSWCNDLQSYAIAQVLHSSNNSEMTRQATLLIELLFYNHTLQEYVSSELARVLIASLDKELCVTSIVKKEIVKVINTLKTAFIFSGIVFGIFFVINALIWGKKSSDAVPFGTMFVLVFL